MDNAAKKNPPNLKVIEDNIKREFALKRDVADKEVAIAVLEELKRRLHVVFPAQDRCSHASEALATVYWLQHQIKIGEFEV